MGAIVAGVGFVVLSAAPSPAWRTKTERVELVVRVQRFPHLRLCMQVDDVDFALREDDLFGEFVAR
jgi:hypothetical protein